LVAVVAWLGSRGLSGCQDRIWLAIVCGVSLATKVNGVILIIAVVMWLVGRNLIANRAPRWAPDLRAIGLLMVLAPVVAFLLWPLMWTDPLMRLGNYVAFVRDHQLTPTWYLGARWAAEGAPNTPWHYPLLMTLAASPLLFLAAALLGILAAVSRVIDNRGQLESFDLLLLLLALGPLSASSLPNAPKYDGLRLFVPMFVPLAILIARIGAGKTGESHRSSATLETWMVRTRSLVSRPLVIATLAVLHAALVLPASGSGLRYYNEVTRLSTISSEVFPLERMYWMEGMTLGVLREIDEAMPQGDVRIKTLAMHGATLEVQQRWGRIPSRYRINPDPPYDVHLLQNRKGFWSRTERGFFRYRVPLRTWPEGSANPYLLMYDGSPPDFPAVVPFTGPE
jgi:hypothetical protein